MWWKIHAVQAVLNQKQQKNEANKEAAVDLDTEQKVNTTQILNILDKMLDKNLQKEKSKRQKTLANAKCRASKAIKHVPSSKSTQIVDERDQKQTYQMNPPKNKQKHSPLKLERLHPKETRINQEISEQLQVMKQKNKSQPTLALRNGYYNLVQMKSMTKKSYRIIQCWARRMAVRPRKQKELEWETCHQILNDSQVKHNY